MHGFFLLCAARLTRNLGVWLTIPESRAAMALTTVSILTSR